jgi:hypothetical protein
MSVAQCFNALVLEAYSLYRQRQQAAVHKASQVNTQVNGLAQPVCLQPCSVPGLDVDAMAHGPDSPKKLAKKKE